MKEQIDPRLTPIRLKNLISWLKSERSRLEKEKNTFILADVLDINKKLMRGRVFYYVNLRVSKESLNYLERRYNPFLIREGRSYKLNFLIGSCTKCESATDFRMVFDKEPGLEIGRSYKIENIPPLDIIDRQIKILDDMKENDSSLKKILFGAHTVKPPSRSVTSVDSKLNERQKEAVLNAINTEDFHLILGPPGTGKTTIISEMCKIFAQTGKKVLLTSWMNVAVDNALDSVLKDNSIKSRQVCRLGAGDYKIAESILPITVPASGFGIGNIMRDVNIVGSTLASAYHTKGYSETPFDIVIVDEAGASTVPETLLALTLAKKFILIGDHLQLPPIVGGENTEGWIKESLFEKLWRMYPSKHTMLNTQYRMDEKIARIASNNIYRSLGGIITSDSVLQRKNPFEDKNGFSLNNDEKKLVSKESPVCWIHVNGEVKWINNGPSHSANNISEIENIEKVLDILVNKEKVDPNRIGVLSPFRYQVSSMINAFEEYVENDVVINTIHSFQGDEKDIVIISLVTDKIDSSRIYDDIRLLNVAITRAKFKLIIVGNTRLTAKMNDVSTMFADIRETAVKCNGYLANNVLRPNSNMELRAKSEKEKHFAREANEIAQLKRSTFSKSSYRY